MRRRSSGGCGRGTSSWVGRELPVEVAAGREDGVGGGVAAVVAVEEGEGGREAVLLV